MFNPSIIRWFSQTAYKCFYPVMLFGWAIIIGEQLISWDGWRYLEPIYVSFFIFGVACMLIDIAYTKWTERKTTKKGSASA